MARNVHESTDAQALAGARERELVSALGTTRVMLAQLGMWLDMADAEDPDLLAHEVNFWSGVVANQLGKIDGLLVASAAQEGEA